MVTQLVLVRHGETEWSRSGQHTGRTDIELTEKGRSEASAVGVTLAPWDFAQRFVSPLVRARETAQLATGSSSLADFVIDDDLMEWDYGSYEGRMTEDIHSVEPEWSKWVGSLEGGESAVDVGVRADRAIARIDGSTSDGSALVVAHGHLLSILVARWLGLDATDGRLFPLDTATVTVLGVKRADRVMRVFNHGCGAPLRIGPTG